MVISASSDVIGAAALLADPVRAQIVRILAQGPACVCHLVEDLNQKQPNISNHVRALRQARLITGENRGRYTYYRLNPDVLEAAAAELTALAAAARAHAGAHRECP